MGKIDQYRATLRTLQDWEPFLLAESGLPGPRGNLELAQAVADEGDEALFRRYLAFDPQQAPVNSPYEFLAFCGTVGIGRLLAEGRAERRVEFLEQLRALASDPRWRTREGVAMALQRLGDRDMGALLEAVDPWAQGTWPEQRAAAAALCEPRLLREPAQVRQVLDILDRITGNLLQASGRRDEDFKTLRKGLAYCWSVAVVALPQEGKAVIERWLALAMQDRDLRWVMKENLKKDRMARMDPDWVAGWLPRLDAPA